MPRMLFTKRLLIITAAVPPCFASSSFPQPLSCREHVSSGALTLDIALGGGFPKGRIIEVLKSCASPCSVFPEFQSLS